MPLFKIHAHRAVLDADGVLVDFDRCFARVATDVLGRPIVKQSNVYSLADRYGLTRPEYERVWAALDEHELGWAGMRVLPGAVEAVAKLRSHGMEIHVVTGIEHRLSEKRLGNLLQHDIQIESLRCVGDGYASKLSQLRDLAPAMFVDDRLRLLYESDFVPDRVWVDHGDQQDGLEVDDTIIQVKSLAQWVDQWSIRHGASKPIRHLRCVP